MDKMVILLLSAALLFINTGKWLLKKVQKNVLFWICTRQMIALVVLFLFSAQEVDIMEIMDINPCWDFCLSDIKIWVTSVHT